MSVSLQDADWTVLPLEVNDEMQQVGETSFPCLFSISVGGKFFLGSAILMNLGDGPAFSAAFDMGHSGSWLPHFTVSLSR